MRKLLLIAAVALLGACGETDESPTAVAADENPAEFVPANDITAIDAVSGDDANMAADIDYIIEPVAENGVEPNAPAPRERAPAASGNRRPRNADAPARSQDAPARRADAPTRSEDAPARSENAAD